jgi:MFS superfamily sulfate permease-like transporter
VEILNREGCLIMWKGIQQDASASLVVFLVALPLCMGIALASGAPPAAGLITGVVGGLVVGFLAGSPLQVSGPAAGLIVIVAGIIQNHGLEKLGLILLLAGLIQVVAGLLRMAQWFRAVSPAVLHGMLAGIGALILLGQLHVMVDGQSNPSGWQNLLNLPDAFQQTFFEVAEESHNPHAAFLGLWTIAIIIIWQKTLQTRLLIPGTLLAVIIISGLTYLLGWQVRFVQVPANLSETIRLLSWPGTETLRDGSIWIAAMIIALIASCESLLCAAAVDQLHQGPRTNFDRELVAQGVGNMLCGYLGALPMTGVIVRSSANIDAGARSRLSAILHGVWLLAFVAFLPWLLNFIPIACLAGILVLTGYKLINFKVVRQLWQLSKGEVFIYAATFAVIVFQDLLMGVMVGMGLSAAKLLYTFTHLKIHQENRPNALQTVLHLEGAATFLRLPRLAAILERVKPETELHVHLERLAYIDHACLELFVNWAKQHEALGGRLIMDWDFLHARFQGPEAREPIFTNKSTTANQAAKSKIKASGAA